MTQTQKIFRTSLFSLLLVVIGLFVVCSGRMQNVGFEDEFGDDTESMTQTDELGQSEEAFAAEEDVTDPSDVMTRLDMLESQDSSGMDSAQPETASGMFTDAPAAGGNTANSAEGFLTPELFNSMRAQVDELTAISSSKDRTIDSLRSELKNVNNQITALEAASQTQQIASNAPSPSLPATIVDDSRAYNSEYGAYYQDALDDYYVRNYNRAIRKFRELIARGSGGELADNCQYWIGEAYFAQGNYYQAIAEFQKVLAGGETNKANDAQLMIGIAYLKAGETELARSELNALLTFAANSSSAKKAMKYLRQLGA
ncbi:MAG: tetratricopeptide repeat protein [candidate division KSB1 bacterium]|nr:tetratricopeptide repeat protein [candidate division KSB1 bacterium]MDZ7275449.1 tetratricopeptide repeat protein [candidate division KSB1 bacterium]MDZ7286239.1 tetratricopeptide repeat protein [candidate division KSB1 bacterium]MDZ7296465.1 tetratricopeptide repeat protein [candidate division KSB1 bacterium]MDZ7305576.1 tetratricopeptide repeat protein [candidate division KSB1 bacterium]